MGSILAFSDDVDKTNNRRTKKGGAYDCIQEDVRILDVYRHSGRPESAGAPVTRTHRRQGLQETGALTE